MRLLAQTFVEIRIPVGADKAEWLSKHVIMEDGKKAAQGIYEQLGIKTLPMVHSISPLGVETVTSQITKKSSQVHVMIVTLDMMEIQEGDFAYEQAHNTEEGK
jgi:hypothetical protein